MITSNEQFPKLRNATEANRPTVEASIAKVFHVAKIWPWECAGPKLVRQLTASSDRLLRVDAVAAAELAGVAASLRKSARRGAAIVGALCVGLALLASPSRAQILVSSPEQASPTRAGLLDYGEYLTIIAAHAADWASTEEFRRRGYSEHVLSNSMVDHKVAFAAYCAGLAGADIWAHQFLLRRHHERLARIGTLIDIAGTATYAIRNYQLGAKPVTPSPLPFRPIAGGRGSIQ